MTTKCAIFKANNFKIPRYNEIDSAQPKGAKVIYGGGKRKIKSIPYIDQLQTVEYAFRKFEEYIVPKNNGSLFTEKELFLFQDNANEMLLKLRYSAEIIAVFEIDDDIINKMHHYGWSLDWIERQAKSFKDDIDSFKFFIENNIGDKNLHKTFPSHLKSLEKMIINFDKSKENIINKATSLFTNGW